MSFFKPEDFKKPDDGLLSAPEACDLANKKRDEVLEEAHALLNRCQIPGALINRYEWTNRRAKWLKDFWGAKLL